MTRRMPHPEEVSHDHIDAAVVGFLRGEKDLNWTDVSLVTLHPREEIRLVLQENRERYQTINDGRFRELVARLKTQGVALQVAYKWGSRRRESSRLDDPLYPPVVRMVGR